MAKSFCALTATFILALLASACSAPAPDGAKAERQSEPDGAVAPPSPLPRTAAVAPPIADIVVDPACLLMVAWFADRESDDIRLNGCRPASAIPSPDENGWMQHESEDGERVMVRNVAIDPASGRLSFDVAYNGGGTMSGRYRVVGTPTGDGILKVGQFTITPLD